MYVYPHFHVLEAIIRDLYIIETKDVSNVFREKLTHSSIK